MNFKALKHHFIQNLAGNYGPEESQAIFYMAVEKISGWSKSKVIFNQEDDVKAIELLRYKEILSQLQLGKPIQYLLGEAHFYGLKFTVNPFVLIPRAETEELVDWILQQVESTAASSLLDIGTGSGCIAISLKKHLKACDVFAMDIAAEALNVAKKNALNNQVIINFWQADILKLNAGRKFDLIVSNPPYIKEDERADMHVNVINNEPHSALFVSNQNPLIFYKAIADFALKSLNDNGFLFFEINEYLGEETMQMLAAKGLKDIILKKDMQGKDRMISCRVNSLDDAV